MTRKKQIRPGEKVPLKLTASERKLVLEDMTCLDSVLANTIQDTPSNKPVMMPLDELTYFGDDLAAEANHCDDLKKQKKFDAILEKIDRLLDTYADDEPHQTLKIEDARKDKAISDEHAMQVAVFAAQALIAADQLRIKTKPLDNFSLAPGQREVVLPLPKLSKTIKNKLESDKPLNVAEIASMTIAVAEALPNANVQNQVALLLVAEHLMDRLHDGIQAAADARRKKKPTRTKKKKNTDALFQFKITLLDAKPPIWRRIQVHDDTLDKLHEHIQTAMGWTNSHLHQFEIKGERYGDPEFLDDGFSDIACEDSTTTMLSDILPRNGKRFAFLYEYDFGDGWEHEILFEGNPQPEKNIKYPVCLEGERACPPEDVGGVWGYAEFLEALADPKHEQHEDAVEWVGEFDPNEFDPKAATRDMKTGLPDWRHLK